MFNVQRAAKVIFSLVIGSNIHLNKIIYITTFESLNDNNGMKWIAYT